MRNDYASLGLTRCDGHMLTGTLHVPGFPLSYY